MQIPIAYRPIYDPRITLGNLLTIAGIILSVMVYYGKVESELEASRAMRVDATPKIAASEQKNLLQDQSIAWLAQSTQQMQASQNDIVSKLGVLQAELASIKSLLSQPARRPD